MATNPYDFLANDGRDYRDKLKQYATDPTAAAGEYTRAGQAANYYSSIGDTSRANAANTWLGQVNTAAGGTLNRPNNDTYNAVNKYTELLSRPREQFSYNPATDPQYQNAMQQALAGAKTASNNAMVGLGARGVGNSSIAVDRANQIQQKAVGDVTSNLLPQLIQQSYNRFMDQQQLNQQQLNNYASLAGLNNNLYQQNFNNQVTEAGLTGNYNGNRTMAGQNQDFNQRIAESNVTGTYNPYAGLIGEMNTNSRNWFTASPEEQQRLAAENQRIGAKIGATQDEQGNWNMPMGIRTLAGQAQDINNASTMAQLTGLLPNGQPTTAEQQRQLSNEWAVAEQTGMVTPTLANLYGIPEGTQTLKAKQLAISQFEANTGRMNAGTSAMNAQTNAGQLEWSRDPNNPDNVYKMSQANNVGSNRTDNNNQFTSTVISNLDQMTPEVRKKFFTDEKKTLVNQLGLSGYNTLYKQYFADDGKPK